MQRSMPATNCLPENSSTRHSHHQYLACREQEPRRKTLTDAPAGRKANVSKCSAEASARIDGAPVREFGGRCRGRPTVLQFIREAEGRRLWVVLPEGGVMFRRKKPAASAM